MGSSLTLFDRGHVLKWDGEIDEPRIDVDPQFTKALKVGTVEDAELPCPPGRTCEVDDASRRSRITFRLKDGQSLMALEYESHQNDARPSSTRSSSTRTMKDDMPLSHEKIYRLHGDVEFGREGIEIQGQIVRWSVNDHGGWQCNVASDVPVTRPFTATYFLLGLPDKPLLVDTNGSGRLCVAANGVTAFD